MKKLLLILLLFAFKVSAQNDNLKLSGVFNCTQLQYGYNLTNTKKGYSIIGPQTMMGYQHKQLYYIGAGFGINETTNWHTGYGITTMPWFIFGRIYLNSSKIRIYIEGELGYNLEVDNSFNTNFIYGETNPGSYGQTTEVISKSSIVGLYINPQIGCSFPVSIKSTFQIGLGILTQSLTINSQISSVYNLYSQTTSSYTGPLDFIQLKIGFTFLN